MRSSFLSTLAVLCFLLVASFVSSQTTPVWDVCPGAPTEITITNMDLTLADRDLNMIMDATVNEQLTSGSLVALSVDLNQAQIFTENIDLGQATTLPIAANAAFVFTYSVSIPSIAPSGNYGVEMVFLDQNGNALTCVNANFTLSSSEMKQPQKIQLI